MITIDSNNDNNNVIVIIMISTIIFIIIVIIIIHIAVIILPFIIIIIVIIINMNTFDRAVAVASCCIRAIIINIGDYYYIYHSMRYNCRRIT